MHKEIAQSIQIVTGMELLAVEKQLSPTPSLEQGDISFPCFSLAKIWQLNPAQAAQKLAESIKLPSTCQKVIALGPYLNFYFERKSFSAKIINSVIEQSIFKFNQSQSQAQNVIVEYSSPNIAKTFHVGHLRTTLIGHALVQINKLLGHNVTGINHLGDWGTQFGFVWAGAQLWGKPQTATINDLVDLYVKASKLKKAQQENTVAENDKDKPDVDKMAKEYSARLEAGGKDEHDFWKWCLDVSMEYFNQIYQRLGVKFDYNTGESFYSDQLPAVEKLLKESHILTESNGDLGVDLGKKLGFVRIFTKDGRSLYITRDIATAIYRYQTFKPARILYVVGAPQILHFQQLVEIMRRLKNPVADVMLHLPYGHIPNMKTREGSAIALSDYLDEAYKRALEAYRNQVSKRPENVNEEVVAEKVAIGATYFYFLSRSNIKDFTFVWDQALSFQGDSGPYLQYAVARINSIEERAKQAGITIDQNIDFGLLSEDSAYEIIHHISKFPQAVLKSANDNEPYHLANYLLDLAKSFSRGYQELKVLDTEPQLAKARLQLFCTLRTVLSKGLNLIGVPVIERM